MTVLGGWRKLFRLALRMTVLRRRAMCLVLDRRQVLFLDHLFQRRIGNRRLVSAVLPDLVTNEAEHDQNDAADNVVLIVLDSRAHLVEIAEFFPSPVSDCHPDAAAD